MKLSILMAALASRSGPMRALIEAQLSRHRQDAELLVDMDDGEATSGIKRQRLLERATGDYVAFVDDDDEVAPNYLSAILEHCNGRVDVVTFDLEMIRDGRRPERWRFGLHPDYRPSGRMCANHLCAWRRDLARRVAFCPSLRYGDDQIWYKPLLMAGLAQTEYHVREVLYRYLFSSSGTWCQKPEYVAAAKAYAANGLKVFRRDDEIFVEEPTSIVVRDANNQLIIIPRSDVNLVATITVD